MAKPLYIKNFIPNSICSFEYFNKLLKNHPKENIHIIDNKRKKYDFSGETKNNQTYIIEDTVKSTMLKPIFFNIRDTLLNKFSELKNCIRWDAHFYGGFSSKSSTFNLHEDSSYTFILQCEGVCKWILPEHHEKILTTGDLLFLPKGVKHACIPMSKRISISFAFWEK